MSNKKFNALTDFKPRGPQQDFLSAMENDGYKYAFLRWHRQLGKDLACWYFLIRHAIRNAGTYYYFFPLKAQSKKALWMKNDPDMGMVVDWIPEQLVVTKQDQEQMIKIKTIHHTEENPSYSVIWVTGCDANRVDDYAGISPNGVIFSEVGPNPSFPDIIGVMMPTIIANNAFLILNSTPRGKNHFWKWEQESKDDPEWFVSAAQNLWPDRPYYTGISTPEVIWKMAKKQGKPDWWVEQEHGVSYEAKVEGAIYASEIARAEKEGRFLKKFKTNMSHPVKTFWDIGVDDDMICIFKQNTDIGEVIIDYWEDNTGLGTDEIAKMLFEKGYYYSDHNLPWDANIRQKGREVKTYLSHFKESLRVYRVTGNTRTIKRDSTKQYGVTRARSKFHNYLWHVDNPNVVKCIDHLNRHQRAFNRVTQTFTEHEAKTPHIHCADAFRGLTTDTTDVQRIHQQAGQGYTGSSYITGVEDDNEW